MSAKSTQSETGPRTRRDLLATFWETALGFWRSGWTAWLLTIAIISVTLTNLFIQYRINVWNRHLFDALERKDGGEVWTQALIFLPLTVANVSLAVAGFYTRMTTQQTWRRWLNARVLDRWITGGRYYQLNFVAGDHANPESRVTDDLRVSVDAPVDFTIGLMNAVLSALMFIGVLWFIGGALTIPGTRITIPGFLVLAAFIYAVAASGAMIAIGRSFVGVSESKNQAEAEYRYGLTRLRENGESIALLGGETEERSGLDEAFQNVLKRWRQYTFQFLRTTVVSQTSQTFVPVVPLILCAPKYLAGEMSLGQVMQAASAFVTVQIAFNWLVDNYPRLADWTASARRVASLLVSLERLDRCDLDEGPRHIILGKSKGSAVQLRDVSVTLDDGSVVVNEAVVEIDRGERVLVEGESGTGKSTLVRAISGLWPWGSGEILLQKGARIFLMPQRPYVPLGTLRRATTYPSSPDEIEDEVVRKALEQVGLGVFRAASRRGLALGEHTLRRREAAARVRAAPHPSARHRDHGRGDVRARSLEPGTPDEPGDRTASRGDRDQRRSPPRAREIPRSEDPARVPRRRRTPGARREPCMAARSFGKDALEATRSGSRQWADMIRGFPVLILALAASLACAGTTTVTTDFDPTIAVMRIDVDDGKQPHKSKEREATVELEGHRYRARIKVRGDSSGLYPKKQFTLKLRAENSDQEVGLLGMAKASSWVLAGPYADKTLIKNVLGLAQARRLFPYAPQTRWMELILNGDYHGVYALTEKIERAQNKVDIPSLKRGGFIFQVDAGDTPYVESAQGTKYTMVYPDDDGGLQSSTIGWLKDWLSAFEASLSTENYTHYVHEQSFIDYFLQQELWKNIDGFRKSMHLYKGADHKVHMGPSWDFDLGAAGLLFWEGTDPEGWRHAQLEYTWPSPDYVTWFNELLRQPRYRQKLIDRWKELRKPGALFSDARIRSMIDEHVQVLNKGPASRNFSRWKVIKRPLFPVLYFTVLPMYDTWEGEVWRSEKFLLDRAAWIDANIEEIGKFEEGELAY